MSPKVADSVKKLRGTFQKSRSNPLAPKVEATDIGPPPDDLAADEAAIWFELAEVVNPLRIAGKPDRPIFALTVGALALAARTKKDRRASANQKIRTSQAAAALLREFGLSPTSRARVSSAPHAVTVDALDEFLFVPGSSGN